MTMNQPGKIYRKRVADQILEDLRGQILSGALPHGAKLPSERDLAAQYGVSGPTIREAIRVLTAMGLVSSRNGSGSTVTAQSDTLIAVSIAAVVQFGNMNARDVFGLLAVLNTYAVRLAAERATDEEVARLREAAERAADLDADSVEEAAAKLKNYFHALAELSHHPLLISLCRFITEVQIGLAVEMSGGKLDRIAGTLHRARMDIVEAVERRDADAAAELVEEYHQRVVDRIQKSRRGDEMTSSDPRFSQLMASLLTSGAALGGEPEER
ncbi:FadR/GntR family transcriptional regulator [Streptomyces sp. NPDC087270]|uniref:FadR/GntR family transcriptional regulator n=1 Tax=Streptomyces sp. NPDC087270 TaxID=3365774 RepID=UPI00380FCF3B